MDQQNLEKTLLFNFLTENVGQIVKNNILMIDNLYKNLLDNKERVDQQHERRSGFNIMAVMCMNIKRKYSNSQLSSFETLQIIGNVWKLMRPANKLLFFTISQIYQFFANPLTLEVDQTSKRISLIPNQSDTNNILQNFQNMAEPLINLKFPTDLIIKICDYRDIFAQFIPYHLKWNTLHPS